MAGIARNSTSDTARVQAIGMLLDRGWGKAPQVHSDEDGGNITIVIRKIIDERSEHASLQELRREQLAVK